jgi:hypothetical protein
MESYEDPNLCHQPQPLASFITQTLALIIFHSIIIKYLDLYRLTMNTLTVSTISSPTVSNNDTSINFVQNKDVHISLD